MKHVLKAIIVLGLFSCSGNSSTEKDAVENSTTETESIDADATENSEENSAFQQFDQAFEMQTDITIDDEVIKALFGDRYLPHVEPSHKLTSLDSTLGIYLFNSQFVMTYMAVFDIPNEKLLSFEEICEDAIRDTEYEVLSATNMVLRKMRSIYDKEVHHSLFIVNNEGGIVTMNLPKMEVPLFYEDGGMQELLEIHGNRWMTVMESTDIIGSLLIYDLKEKKLMERYSVPTGEYYFQGDSLIFEVVGDEVGDTLLPDAGYPMSKIQLHKFVLYDNGELHDRGESGVFVMH